ncbi:hypothetical protein STEG23_005274, partial [Scotinomys teguina]
TCYRIPEGHMSWDFIKPYSLTTVLSDSHQSGLNVNKHSAWYPQCRKNGCNNLLSIDSWNMALMRNWCDELGNAPYPAPHRPEAKKSSVSSGLCCSSSLRKAVFFLFLEDTPSSLSTCSAQQTGLIAGMKLGADMHRSAKPLTCYCGNWHNLDLTPITTLTYLCLFAPVSTLTIADSSADSGSLCHWVPLSRAPAPLVSSSIVRYLVSHLVSSPVVRYLVSHLVSSPVVRYLVYHLVSSPVVRDRVGEQGRRQSLWKRLMLE